MAKGCLVGLAVVAALGALLVVAVLAVVFRKAHEKVTPASTSPTVTFAPPGAALSAGDVVFDADATGNYEIYVLSGEATARRLTRDTRYDSWWPRPSPDRKRVLFVRTPAGVHDNPAKDAFRKLSVWVMNADGSGAIEIIPDNAYGWVQFGHPEWSPDGRALALFAGSGLGTEIWVTDATGRNGHALTDRGGSNVDPSWSPDGRAIAFVGCPSRICLPGRREVYTVAAAGGTPVRLTHDAITDNDPYFSPDGTKLAWLSQTQGPRPGRVAGVWNIRVANADGSGVRMLTNDDNVNSKPAWSRDGRTIFFHRLVYGAGARFELWSVDVATGRLARLDSGSRGAASEYPAPVP